MEKFEQKTPDTLIPQETSPKISDNKIEYKDNVETPQETEHVGNKNPEILPMNENTERDEFTPEQVEEARLEMEAELLENKKIEVISKAAFDECNEDVKKMAAAIDRSLGGRASSMSIWEGMRRQLANSAHGEIRTMIGKIRESAEPNSALDQFAKEINTDLFEPKGLGQGAYDITDADYFCKTASSYITERGAELTGKDLEDVENVLKAATLNAEYKFFFWQSARQLESVIAAQEELSKLNDEFDPEKAGFFELRHFVENGLASIKLDLDTKPNYRYSSPELAVRERDLNRMLLGLCKIEARQFLKDHDIDLEGGSEDTEAKTTSELPPENVREPAGGESEAQKNQEKDAEALRKVRQSLGMSESQSVPSQIGEQEAVPKSETTEIEESEAEAPDRLGRYRRSDSSVDYRKIIGDLSDRNYTGDAKERMVLADEALAQLKIEAEAVSKQIEAEKQRERELRQSGKWDGSQKSESRNLNAIDDALYGYEQSINRIKRDLEKNVSHTMDRQQASDRSTADAQYENRKQNFVEINDKELREEVGNSLSDVVQDIDGLESSLRVSGSFITPRFEADILRTAIGESGIDFRKISEVLEDTTKKLKRDFTTEPGGRRPMIESGHYRRTIGALENLENSLTKFRSKIEQRKTETDNGNFKNLEKEISTAIGTARKNREFLDELRRISQRFEDGR